MAQFTQQQFYDFIDVWRPTGGAVKIICPKNLANFRGESLKDYVEFFAEHKGCAESYKWNDEDKKRHFSFSS